MKRSQLVRESELQACRVIQRMLNSTLIHNDDGSRPGMFDYRIDFADGRTAAIEVVTDTEPEVAELAAAIRRHKIDPGEGRLQYDWSVTVKTAARIKRLRQELPCVLHNIEQSATKSELSLESVSAFERQLGALGVEYAYAVERVFGSGRVNVELHDFRYGSLNPDSIPDRCSTLLQSHQLLDVRKKLRLSDCDERHVAIVFPVHSKSAVSSALASGIAPGIAPIMPSGITHLWAISTSLSQAAAYWEPDRKWQFSSISVNFTGSGRIGPISVILNSQAFGKPANWSITDPASGTFALPVRPQDL